MRIGWDAFGESIWGKMTGGAHSRRMTPVKAAAPRAVTIQPASVNTQRAHQRCQPHGPRVVEGAQASV